MAGHALPLDGKQQTTSITGATKPPKELLTVAEAARILVCSEANVYGLIDAGQLPYVPIGKAIGPH